MNKGLKQGLLIGITELAKEDEDYAIEILDMLLDEVWTKKEILGIIEETLPEEKHEDHDYNADNSEIEREYRRSVI